MKNVTKVQSRAGNSNDGMPGGMFHPHASHGEAVISGENDEKWHVVMLKSYYYIHMIQAAIQGRFLVGLTYASESIFQK